MTVHEVLVAARNNQARRGFKWANGCAFDGAPCCPEAAIAEAVGELIAPDVATHPGSLRLADEFPESIVESVSGKPKALSERAFFSTPEEVLAAFDRAIAATAPEPDTSFLNEALEVA